LTENVGGFKLTWGVWDGSEQTPLSLQTDSRYNSVSESLNDRAIIVSLVPTEIANLQGTNKFIASDEFLALGGASGGGEVSQILGEFDVDFGSGFITNGELQVCVGGENSHYKPHFSQIAKVS